MKLSKKLLISSVVATFVIPVLAQDTLKITVTGTRSPKPVDSYPGTIDVIDKDELSIKSGSNIKKLTNQYNNYIYPKPCEGIETEWIQKNRYQTCDPNYHWHKLWPEYPYSRKKMNILVAGCGSDQAAILAKCNPIHNFIGIDLSEESLKKGCKKYR